MIRLLDEIVQNKIAAGEVVERPSAAIKELVENSIDSGASLIRIDLEQGGKSLIRVVDDGGGIEGDELTLAVRQHATSKIASAEDLFSVKTMGFRGEALASIASISQLQISSRVAGKDAFTLRVDGGRIMETTPGSCPNGTMIEARNLFFNTPVRLKFLKSDSAELAKAVEIISCLAMANPKIGFQLSHNGKEQIQLPKNQSLPERIQSLLPLNLTDSLIEIPEFDGGFFKIRGYLGSPYLIRPRRDHQYIFVNGRVVKDKLLQGAVAKMYDRIIPNGKYPVVILYLEVDPSEVDVNVHPTKFEVRFTQSGSIFSALLQIGEDVLRPHSPSSNSDSSMGSNSLIGDELGVKPFGEGYGKPGNSFDQFASNIGSENSDKSFSLMNALKSIYGEKENDSAAVYSVNEKVSDSQIGSLFDPNEKVATIDKPLESAPIISSASGIITIDKTFLIAGIGNDLYMIDQHAIHERMLYERLVGSLESGSMGIQQLLYPVTISIGGEKKALLLENSDELNRLGFLVEDFGEDGLIVRGVPVDAKKIDIESFFYDLADNFDFKQKGDLNKGRHKMCATIACHSSYRAGDEMSHLEKLELFKYAYKNKDLLTCPHGRPTVIVYTPKDFAKMFFRS